MMQWINLEKFNMEFCENQETVSINSDTVL